MYTSHVCLYVYDVHVCLYISMDDSMQVFMQAPTNSKRHHFILIPRVTLDALIKQHAHVLQSRLLVD